ncbi:MAG: carbohydrate ABC transporter substrate-binding protein [Chloroflexi bacterium]|nr:MAG: carbohydrate ABC transporter substrate-binding protein [Chloroflexota bacterium]
MVRLKPTDWTTAPACWAGICRRNYMGDSSEAKRVRHAASGRIMVPNTGIELPLNLDLSRRDILKIAGYGSLAAFIAACGGGSPGSSGSANVTAKGGSVSIGSNASDPGVKKGLADIVSAFTSANGGTKVRVNTVDHGTFQNTITSYLGGTPEDVFTWFSGHRMRFFASKGLVAPIDDVWSSVKGNFTEGFAASVKGDDGHVYAVPTDYYPWAVFYRKDVFAAGNYKVPTNWDDFKSLCAQMKKDGLIPLAFADKDGWPAQGTFDIINLRLNGYDFHIELLTGKQKWTDSRVTSVFKKWSEITQYYSPAFAGLKWEQGADQLLRKQAGMMVFGLFISDEFTASGSKADLDQLDFFPFPDLGTQYDAEKALDAPIDVFMMSKKSPTLGADSGQAKAFLEFMAKGSTQSIYWQSSPGSIPTAKDTDTSQFPALTQKAVQIVSNAKRITQFFDRDSRPDYAGPDGMQGFLLKYLSNPSGSTSSLQGQMQSFWDSLPPE